MCPWHFILFVFKSEAKLQNDNILKLNGEHISAHYIILSCFLYVWNVILNKEEIKKNEGRNAEGQTNLEKYTQTMCKKRI